MTVSTARMKKKQRKCSRTLCRDRILLISFCCSALSLTAYTEPSLIDLHALFSDTARKNFIRE